MLSQPQPPLPPGLVFEADLAVRPGVRVVRARRAGREPVVVRLEVDPGGSAGETDAELAIFAAVSHPGLARVLDFGELGTAEPEASGRRTRVRWLAREWIEGRDLLSWSAGRTPEEVGAVVARLTPALEHLHRAGFVHSDLKAENVLVADDGRVVLCDFGLARRAESREAGVSGSLFAIAPELLIGGVATPAADLFALGALLHRLLAPGRVSAREFYARFPARSFFDAAGTSPEELPAWARDVVAALTAREPSRRPRSAAAVGATLAARLGLSSAGGSAVEQERLEWPVEEGREGWMRSLTTLLEELGPQDPNLWLRTPAAEDPSRLFERLRLSSALGGQPGTGLDLEQELARIQDGLGLDRWARALAHELGGAVYLLVGEDDWHLRAVRSLAGAVRQVRARTDGAPRLIVVTSGPAPDDPLEWEERRVPPVEESTVRAFLVQRMPDEERARVATLAARLADVAEGSASVLDELLAEAREGGLLVPREGGFVLRPGPLAVVAPRAVDAQALPPAEAALLSACWLCGGEAAADELAAVAGLERDAFACALLALAEARHVALERRAGRLAASGEPPAPSFARERGTDALQVRARSRVRPARALLAELHERRAAWLSEQSGETSLARAHAWAAGKRAADRDELVAALAEERRRGCPERALETLQHVEVWLDALGRGLADEAPELVLERADAWCDLGRYERAGRTLEALAAAEQGPERRSRIELALARVAGRRHLADEARAHLARALELDPAVAAEVKIGELRLAHAAGRNQEVLDAARSFVDGPLGADVSARERSYVSSLAAMSLFRLGRVDEARAETTLLIDAARADDDPGREAALRINLATIERRSGSLERAREELGRSVALYERAGYVAGLAHARATLGGLLRETGEFQEAEKMLVAALEARERLGDVEDVTSTRGMLGLLAFERGHAREAIELLTSAAAHLQGAERRRFAPLLLAHADEMRARIGVAPETPLDEASSPDPRVLASRARTAALLGELELARGLARRALELAESLKLSHLQSQASVLNALLAPDRERAPVPEPGECDALLAQDLELRALLAGKGEAFAVTAAERLAHRLEALGRDDRAARLWSALGARSAEPADYAAQAERCFAACAAGLSEDESTALRLTLLGLPDPWPGDFAPRPGPAPEEELEMEVVSVLDINKRLLRQEDLESLLGEIVEHAMALTGAERGFLVLEEQGRLRYDLARDSARGDVARPEFEVSGSVVSEALAAGRILRISNAVDDPLLGHTTSVVALELRSILCVPFDVRPGLRGALYLDHRLRTGAFDERAERLVSLFASQAALAIQQVQRLDEIRHLNRELERRVAQKESDLQAAQRALRGVGGTVPASGLIGASEAMREVHRFLERAAPSPMPVLVIGESGTGKELAARSLHELSPRKKRPFVSESCAAIPASLVESELFGSVKGAYTGADQDRPGLFERAEGGTLFLDEIGELPLELQAKLLRVLETSEIRRLGSSETTPVSFRLVAATNRDLEQEVAAGRFRADLYYRLDGLRLKMPTLAERPEDVEPLVHHFLRLQEAESGVARQISRPVLTRLCRRAWPGNVRELRNEVARLCVLCEGDLDDPAQVREPSPGGALGEPGPGLMGVPGATGAGGGVVPLAELERAAIQAALAQTGDDKRKAAELLGISRATIYKRIKDWEEGAGS